MKFLRENATNPRVRKSLYEVEAESATFMGQLIWDVSQRRDHVAPITYLDEAVNAARQVHDPCAESYATLRKSFVALYGEKDPIKGVTLAQESAEVAKLCSPSLTGLAMLHVAEGYAMTNDLKAREDESRQQIWPHLSSTWWCVAASRSIALVPVSARVPDTPILKSPS